MGEMLGEREREAVMVQAGIEERDCLFFRSVEFIWPLHVGFPTTVERRTNGLEPSGLKHVCGAPTDAACINHQFTSTLVLRSVRLQLRLGQQIGNALDYLAVRRSQRYPIQKNTTPSLSLLLQAKTSRQIAMALHV